jgi:hypothetical protein
VRAACAYSDILMIRGFSFVTMSRSLSIVNVSLAEGMVIGEEGRRLRGGSRQWTVGSRIRKESQKVKVGRSARW